MKTKTRIFFEDSYCRFKDDYCIIIDFFKVLTFINLFLVGNQIYIIVQPTFKSINSFAVMEHLRVIVKLSFSEMLCQIIR